MKIYSIDEIFVLPSLRELTKQILSGPPGIVAITGLAGSGKSNTLFSLGLEVSRQGIPISVIRRRRYIKVACGGANQG